MSVLISQLKIYDGNGSRTLTLRCCSVHCVLCYGDEDGGWSEADRVGLYCLF